MVELSIEEIKKIQYDMLLFFHDFCEKHGITYYMSNGTLLGAVKYKGYIPWDDDIDICMPRPDYEKMIELCGNCEQSIGGGYTLFSTELNDEYLFPFAKLSKNDTVLEEKNVNNGVTLGVNVDIFPLDSFGNSEEEAKKIYRSMEKLRKQLLWAKDIPKGTPNPVKRLAKIMIALPYKLKGARRICLEITRLAKKRNYGADKYIGNVVWGFYSPGEAHDKKVFSDKISLKFEDNDFWAPIGYDAFLRKLYGDYSLNPPLEKQVTHHSYMAYKKEDK